MARSSSGQERQGCLRRRNPPIPAKYLIKLLASINAKDDSQRDKEVRPVKYVFLETADALMFPGAVGQHGLSLMPASEFAQKKVGVVARLADVVHDDRAVQLAGVVDNDVTKA